MIMTQVKSKLLKLGNQINSLLSTLKERVLLNQDHPLERFTCRRAINFQHYSRMNASQMLKEKLLT